MMFSVNNPGLLLDKCSIYMIIYKICGCGGIGRRARFRFWCLSTCRFKSCHPHPSERTLLRSDFCLHKNRSHAPSFLLFREKSRSVRLFVCKRTHDGSLSLPTFHDIVRFTHMKTLDFTVFLQKSCKNTRTKV